MTNYIIPITGGWDSATVLMETLLERFEGNDEITLVHTTSINLPNEISQLTSIESIMNFISHFCSCELIDRIRFKPIDFNLFKDFDKSQFPELNKYSNNSVSWSGRCQIPIIIPAIMHGIDNRYHATKNVIRFGLIKEYESSKDKWIVEYCENFKDAIISQSHFITARNEGSIDVEFPVRNSTKDQLILRLLYAMHKIYIFNMKYSELDKIEKSHLYSVFNDVIKNIHTCEFNVKPLQMFKCKCTKCVAFDSSLKLLKESKDEETKELRDILFNLDFIKSYYVE